MALPSLEHNGARHSCDHYVQLAAPPQQQAFGKARLTTLPEYCQTCDVRSACNGGKRTSR